MSAVAVPYLSRYVLELGHVHDRIHDFVERCRPVQGVIEPALSFWKEALRQIGLLPARQHEIHANILRPPF